MIQNDIFDQSDETKRSKFTSCRSSPICLDLCSFCSLCSARGHCRRLTDVSWWLKPQKTHWYQFEMLNPKKMVRIAFVWWALEEKKCQKRDAGPKKKTRSSRRPHIESKVVWTTVLSFMSLFAWLLYTCLALTWPLSCLISDVSF